ncbi:ATP-binding protein [Aspergillus foveolatus]|uniref:ATP-binding protein n=1 Tax=Aspergillus foveolatus TaxID=210207 RepID=UPI003CCD7411
MLRKEFRGRSRLATGVKPAWCPRQRPEQISLQQVQGALLPRARTRMIIDLSASRNTSDKPAQEIKITRVPPENWRAVKKLRSIDPEQSILLTSSKGSSSLVLRQARRNSQSTTNLQALEQDAETSKQDRQYAPYRLAINSKYLLNILESCTETLFTEEQNVLVRPFKYLVEFESDIKDLLESTESLCKQAEDEMSRPAKQEDIEHTRAMAAQLRRERDELRCLVEFMDHDMRDIFEIKRAIQANTLREIAFEHLWQLYKPGDVIYRTVQDDDSRRQAFRVLHVTGGRVCFDTKKLSYFDPVNYRVWDSESEDERRCRDAVRRSSAQMTNFIIDCFYLESDGVRLAPRPKRFAITPYSGKRPIASLPLRPLQFDPQKEVLEKQLVARGARFMEVAQGKHMEYHGNTIEESKNSPFKHRNHRIEAFEVHGEVIVDQEAGVTHFQDTLPAFSLGTGGGIVLTHTEADSREVSDFFPQKSDGDWVTDVFNDAAFEEYRHSEYFTATDLLTSRPVKDIQLSDDQLLLLPPRVYGYSLLDRRWVALNVSLLQEISIRDKQARSKLEDLVLPTEHKRVLQALITNQVRLPHGGSNHVQGQFSMDAVPAKGKGLIILLHGAPGVGKTSTAECIAIELNRPLLSITCGHIGTIAEEAEKNLDSFCKLAHRWRCVLLLDEADVFLAKRERGDIARNSLVSVFLRVLEYFSGVIILTTNRVGEFDEAFRSRIHVCLYYPKLEERQTKEIWEKNIQRIKESNLNLDMEEKKIRRFADQHWQRNLDRPTRRWNGRQIKNAFQTAIALANWEFYDEKNVANLERPLLKAKHFRYVAQITAHFDDYISDIYGTFNEDTYSFLAARDALRVDEASAMFASRSTMQENSRASKSGIVRRGTNFLSPPANPGRPQGTSYDRYSSDDDESTDEEEEESEGDNEEEDDQADEVKKLELQLQLAKLKNRKASTRGSKR